MLLVGAGHSGSTLLDLIMDSHSKIVGVGELSHYRRAYETNVSCSCKKIVKNCEFWKKVFDKIDASKLPLIYQKKLDFLLNKNKYFYFDDYEKEISIKNYVSTTEKIYRKILQESGKSIIFDSSKSYYRAEAIIKSNSNLDITLIHLVRDGRGVAYSNIKLGRNGFSFMKKWMMTNLKIELIKLRNKNIKNIFILYEDFIKDPEKVLTNILEQVGTTFEPSMLKFRDSEHHQPGGNLNLRVETNSDKIRLDNKWINSMSILNKITFIILFRWLNIFYKRKS